MVKLDSSYPPATKKSSPGAEECAPSATEVVLTVVAAAWVLAWFMLVALRGRNKVIHKE